MIHLQTESLFDLSHTLAKDLLGSVTYPWEALPKISEFLCALGEGLSPEEYDKVGENVWIAKDATIAASASITGPCIVGHRSQVRVGAYIRGSVLVGDDCVVGNSCELKNAILFDRAQVPHFNYVGDSILGYRAHTGAGAITSNVKSDKALVVIRAPDGAVETGLKKCGAMIGDCVEIGCGCVLNPGVVIGRNTTVYPLSSVRGVLPPDSIFKSPDCIVPKT